MLRCPHCHATLNANPNRPLGSACNACGQPFHSTERDDMPVEMDWRTAPPPVKQPDEAGLAQTDDGAEDDYATAASPRFDNSPTRAKTNRTLVAGTLTLAAWIIGGIGIARGNSDIMLVVVGGLLATAGLVTLFTRPRRAMRYQQATDQVRPNSARTLSIVAAVLVAVAVTIAAIDHARQREPDQNDQQKQQPVAAVPLQDQEQPHKQNCNDPKPIELKRKDLPEVLPNIDPERDPAGPKRDPGQSKIDSDNQPIPPVGFIPEEKPDPRLLGTWRTTWKESIHTMAKEWTLRESGLMTSRRYQNGNAVNFAMVRWAVSGELLAIQIPDEPTAEKLYYRFKFQTNDELEVTPVGKKPEVGQKFPLVFVRIK